jgi:anti-anti-sigma factor
MSIQNWSDNIVIATLTDEPQFSEEMSLLLQRLPDNSGETPDVIIDLKDVSYLNSSNIAQLLRLRRRVIDAHRRLRLCSVADPVWSMLMVAGLDKLFDFTDDVSTSLASLQITR